MGPTDPATHAAFYHQVGQTMVNIEQETPPMDPMNIDTSQGKRIAHASSQGWLRTRWTEINVYHFPDGLIGGKCWLAEVIAKSNVEGERTKTRRLASASLERALKIIDESDIGITVRETAFEYAEDEGILPRLPGMQRVPATAAEALVWLMPNAKLGDLDRIFGNGDFTTTLLALLPFVDRKAFQAWVSRREKGNG